MAGFQDLRVSRTVNFSGATKIGVGDPLTKGKVIYVDSRSWGVGASGRTGSDPNYPLNTITNALALCTAGNGDYILCLDGYDNDAVTITVAKSNVHIIGLGSVNHRAPFVWLLVNAGAAPVFTLQGSNAANCEIAGFTLGADASNACIVRGAGGSTELMYAWIHHNAFAASEDAAFVAQDGILFSAGGDGTLIEDCTFGDEITRDGIRFVNLYGGMIRRCLFDNCGSIAIDAITGGAAAGGMPDVLDNKFHANATGASEGWAITSMAAGDGFIDGNHASDSYTTPSNNPYLDHNDVCQWGLNYSHLTATAPATT
jgi:hypothetical protein